MEEQKSEVFKPDVLQILIAIIANYMEQVGQPLTAEQLDQIEDEVRADLGGLRVRIPKRGKHPTDEQKARIKYEALNSEASEQELTQRYGISRSTLYRYIKRG